MTCIVLIELNMAGLSGNGGGGGGGSGGPPPEKFCINQYEIQQF